MVFDEDLARHQADLCFGKVCFAYFFSGFADRA
jgi:hypothetical protein